MLRLLYLSLLVALSCPSLAQTTVFSSDFNTSAGTAYTTANGPIGSSGWSLVRSGTDMGARINAGLLTLTNDATGSYNNNGWALAYATTGAASPYTSVLNTNPGIVTWTFNMRQIRSNPSYPTNGYYSNAFVLAGTTNTTATTGSGYAVILGQSGTTDRLRLIRYTAGLRTSTDVIASNTSGLSDFGNQYLSVKVAYTPSTNTWQLYVRNDGTVFQDPSIGNLTSQGTAVNSASTATSLPFIGAFWNAAARSAQTAFFDNVKVTVAVPTLLSISPTSKVAGTGAFTLTVTGTNFISGSAIRWNGANLTTTYVSATQLTATVPAANIAAAGTAAITIATGAAVSNALSFTIDPAAVPSISASTNTLSAFTTTTGTASAVQSFTSTGSNLTGPVTITAPSNFEVSLNGGAYGASVSAPAATSTIGVRVRSTAPAGIYNDVIMLTTPGGATKQVVVTATIYATEPATSATAVTFNNATSISFTTAFTVGNGANRLVVLRAGSAVNSSPVDGTTYTASAQFGAGSEIGDDNYVVYNGASNAVTITGLSPTTSYYVAVYEYNGTAGTQNYKITTSATGSRTTLNAPVGLQIGAVNTRYVINFDNTVEGVNNGAYSGGGFSATPEDGELNSNAFVTGPATTGAVTFGGETDEDDPSFGNGTSEGSVTDGGLYAFEVAQNNYALGIQPTGDYASGSTTLRFQNQTGVAITTLSIGYKVYVYNDESGANSYNFSYSANNSTYTAAPALNLTTTAADDAAPGWKAYYKVITLTGLNVTSNSYYYIRWSGAPVSGSAYDEIALDDVVIVANPDTNYAGFSGTAETFVLAGNASLTGNTTVNENITFTNGNVNIGANTLILNGTVTNTVTGGIKGNTNSNLEINGVVSPVLSFDQTAGNNVLNNLSINTTAENTTTLGNNLIVNGILTVGEQQTLNLATSTLSGTLATITNNGIVMTQNTTATPFASGKTWGGVGTLILNAATAAQTLVAGTYNNVTVSTTGGAVATGNITANGIFHLPNANPAANRGSFNTGTFTLTMGANATNTGIGDVSGIITRTSIVPNISYTFGHPGTAILFATQGTLPTTLSMKTVLGSAPANKTDAILRTYDFTQTGASASAPTKAIITAHYLDSELNNNIESRLVDWVVVLSPAVAVVEQSRTNYNTTQNYVELANVAVDFFSSSFGVKQLTLANSQLAGAVWNGSVSDVWIHAPNWTPNGVPSGTTNVIIPNANSTNFDPVINPGSEVKSLSIEAGAIITSPANATLTVKGSTGAWINFGAFNAGTGTSSVVFDRDPAFTGDATIAGNTTFNNVSTVSGTILKPLSGNVMNVAGTFTNGGNFIAGGVNNTVVYSGINQTLVEPNGATLAYHNLIINGIGAVFPASLNINGSLTTNQAVNFAGKTITLSGTDEQNIAGSVSPVFNNIIINKTPTRVLLATDATVSGTLTLTSGVLDIGNYNLTLGANAVAGVFSDTTMIEAEDNGVVRRPFTGPGSYLFPLGEGFSNTTYSPITVNVTSASSFTNGYIGVNVKDAVHPNNSSTDSYLTRYWNVKPTGITNAVVSVNANYRIGDAVGGESNLQAAQLNGTFNVNSNPWVKFGTLSSTTLTATDAILTDGQTSVFTAIKGGTVSAAIIGAGTFCANTSVVLSSEITGGNAPYTYSWSNGLGTDATVTPPTNTPGSFTYTLTVKDANGITATTTATIIVTVAPVAGTVSGNQSICANTTPNAITLSDYTGNIVRWERSTTTAFANPAFIASTSATLTGTEIGTALTSTRYVRAVVQNGSCDVVYSNAVEIKINTNTWNGTSWSNGTPTATDAVVFNGNYTAATNLNACTIVINDNAAVTIPTGITVTVNGAVTVTSGSLTIQNNAALVQLTDATNSGNITVIKNSNPLFRLDYTLWSSPVTGQNLLGFSPQTTPNRFYEYKYAYDNVTNIHREAYFPVEAATNSFAPAKSYLIRMPNSNINVPGYNGGTDSYSYEGTFTGLPNNGIITRVASVQGNRYTAIGNPYPSPISVVDFFAENIGVIDNTSSLYFWRKKSNSDTSSYASLNLTGFTANQGQITAGTGGQEQSGFYPNVNINDNINWLISQGQGFIVKTKANPAVSEINFTNSMRRAVPVSGQQPFFRTTAPAMSRFWLNLTDAQGSFSQALIAYSNTTTRGLDYGYDGKLLNDGGRVALYTLAEDTNLSIQARQTFDSTDVVPVGFIVTAAGQYTINLDNVDGLFGQGQLIFLKDNLLGTVTSLENAYTFTSEAGTFSDRFEVVYAAQQNLGTNILELDPNSVMVFKDGTNINISAKTTEITSINVFDIRGRKLYAKAGINATEAVVNGLHVQQQVLIVEIHTSKGKVTKRIVF
jgi:hypothetical protein